MREATSVYKGWVVVGLILLVSGLAGFQVINSYAYAQLLENSTADSSSVTNLPSNLIQNQLSADQDSLIATPGPSSEDLNPSKQDPSIADEKSLDTGGNSIVQSPAPRSEQLENSQPGVDEQDNQPRTSENDNSANEGRRGNQEVEEASDGGNEGDEGDEGDGSSIQEIPSSLHNWYPGSPPFP